MTIIFAADLAVPFLVDGSHVAEDFVNLSRSTRALCDFLILHDKIVIPIEDFTVLRTITRSIGADNLILLLKNDRVRFVRTIGTLALSWGDSGAGLMTIHDAQRRVAAYAPMEASIQQSIHSLELPYATSSKLSHIVAERTKEIQTLDLLSEIRSATYADFEKTLMWRDEFRTQYPDLLKMPGDPRNVQIYGPNTPPSRSAATTLLALARSNLEMYLSSREYADALSTTCPIGDSVSLKLANSAVDLTKSGLQNLINLAGVADLTPDVMSDSKIARKFIEVTCSPEAVQFREWFKSQIVTNPEEYTQRYMDIIHKISPLERPMTKIIRFFIFQSLGFIPIIGNVTSAFDTFVLDKLVEGNSPKYFVQNLRNFSGAVKMRRI
ncbi:hypothetical protein QO010_000196 [Caulobacter ginsengisoli]|uniref:Uncharacterized protein n=1 Tax=Caulobacter ginsengisoli TaxID=400775 RepID=A0ABU0IMR7_9CAUL|nr:hypothetical protein [Caulobacter ginsengisoli]MDQ0462448.1 hypothetical protein [Caulobacter ginsengisoli]